MKFLIYSGEYDTATDGIIYQGIRNILSQIYPNCTYEYLPKSNRFFRDCSQIPDSVQYPDKKFDAIIIPGSPWLWDQFHTTWKIKNLLRCRELHPEAKIIWMGIGSCLPLDNPGLMRDQPHKDAIRKIFKDDLIIVRDKLAKNILANAGVSSYLLKCPSFYSTQKPKMSPKSESRLIVYYEPTIGISHSSWENTEQLERYYDIFREYSKQDCDIVVKDPEEVPFAKRIGLPEPRVLVDCQDTIDTVAKYDEVLSGRVHVAVPALASGCKVGIIPVDSRAQTITDWLDCDINSKVDLDNLVRFSYNREVREYSRLIRDFLGE